MEGSSTSKKTEATSATPTSAPTAAPGEPAEKSNSGNALWNSLPTPIKNAIIITISVSIIMIPNIILDKDHENTPDGWFSNIGIINIALIFGYLLLIALIAKIFHITIPKMFI